MCVGENYSASLFRGIPSVFSEVKPLYSQAGKAAVIESVLLSSLDTLRSGALPDSTGVSAPNPGDVPTSLLWTLLFAGKVSVVVSHPRLLKAVLDVVV